MDINQEQVNLVSNEVSENVEQYVDCVDTSNIDSNSKPKNVDEGFMYRMVSNKNKTLLF